MAVDVIMVVMFLINFKDVGNILLDFEALRV